MSQILDSIKSKLKDAEEKRTALVAEIRKEFPALLADVFAKSDTITSIGWKQYTPYFNDGDECTFSTRVDDIEINGEDSYDIELSPEDEEIKKEFESILTSISDNIYKDLFGDHISITINKNGTIETEEYEHD